MLSQILQRKLREFYFEFTCLYKSELLFYRNCLLTSLLALGYMFIFDLCLRIFNQASQGENITKYYHIFHHVGIYDQPFTCILSGTKGTTSTPSIAKSP